MNEYDKMRQGLHFNSSDRQLRQLREMARLACAKFNAHPSKGNLKHITRLFSHCDQAYIEPTFQCDYGVHIYVGKNFYANFNCVLLDSATITIGDNVLLGPSVHLYTVDHPRDPNERRLGLCVARPITIGNDVWIGGGAKVLPGVNIGDGCIIAANTVVRQSLAPHQTYYG